MLTIFLGQWSSGMIPASGAGGRGFNSPLAPFLAPREGPGDRFAIAAGTGPSTRMGD